ncbi:MAG: hypothetical protein A3D74_00440 [Candidatus Levybacteria bacterium RIFCSPHIGHO2_02_FULL_37_13]|nr:MAG: hypothetical protein A3D74_00440 [Candidatus Levybacteria bacterium RIFCSPHIGHO2_02_FULL_37_13]OGH37392.1 MAG: hypothetical protein A3B41_03255 [Candidatus Levybacteria bacterium RIFCSPLOWO2_01_FULL_37_26]
MSTEQEHPLTKRVNAELLNKPEKALVGNSALITGATRMNGIGFAIAERFALEGASPIFIVGTENSKDIAPFAQSRLKRYAGVVYTLIGDVTNEESCIEMMKHAYDLSEGNVNILVNNAGTNRNQTLTEITTEDWNFVMYPKALGALLMTREWFRIRNEKGIRGGRVINIGSVIGEYGNFGQDTYAMANAALRGLTKTQSLTLGRRGITVNIIEPGFVEGTDMTSQMQQEQVNAVKTVSALNELIRPRDIAGAALYLAGKDGERVTGSVLAVDSGIQSNYTAAQMMYQAGLRRVPRYALGIIANLSQEEVTMIQQARKKKAE